MRRSFVGHALIVFVLGCAANRASQPPVGLDSAADAADVRPEAHPRDRAPDKQIVDRPEDPRIDHVDADGPPPVDGTAERPTDEDAPNALDATKMDASALDATAARPRNILLFVVDDLNAWVGHLGTQANAKTPHIDRLAKRGLSFTRAYTAASVCNPSRAAFLSGKRPSTSGVYDNDTRWEPLLRNVATLPQHLMRNGYRTMASGKIFHGGDGRTPAYWHEILPRQLDPLPAMLNRSGLGHSDEDFDWAALDVPNDAMGDHKVASWAVERLARTYDKPFFLAVGFFKPHLPWYVPRKYFDMHPVADIQPPVVNATDLSDVPPLGRAMAENGDHPLITSKGLTAQAIQAYLAAGTFADEQIGRVLDALDHSPHKDDTIVVLTGDHGWHLGEKLHWRKIALWEEATRTPLIFVVPGTTTADTRCDRPVDLLALYPTLLDLLNVPAPAHELDGTSLAPLLADPLAPWSRPALTTMGRGNHALRTDRWRYIRYRDGTEELYDHDADPREWTNVAGNANTAAVRAELRTFLPDTEAP